MWTNFEYLSEDPYLTSEMAYSYVKDCKSVELVRA